MVDEAYQQRLKHDTRSLDLLVHDTHLFLFIRTVTNSRSHSLSHHDLAISDLLHCIAWLASSMIGASCYWSL